MADLHDYLQPREFCRMPMVLAFPGRYSSISNSITGMLAEFPHIGHL
jgi:hypothetical protein